jgi:pimeloyl-ACP methyl ester carboxylesterase
VLRAYASGRLFGEGFGDGPPWALALHGWARTHADFAGVLGPDRVGGQALDAVALDLPGFGATPVPPAAWGSPEYAVAVSAMLDELAPKIVLLGHSFGGRVAVHLAATHPDRVEALVLTGVPLFRPAGARVRPNRGYRAIRGLARAGLVGAATLERARERYGSSDYRAASGVMRDVLVTVLGEDYEPAMREVRCPTVLLWGEQDFDVPLEVARRAAGVIPGARLEVLPGIGHLTPTAAPEGLREALLASRP